MSETPFYDEFNKLRKPGESDRSLARRCGMEPARIGQFRRGALPMPATIRRFCTALGLPDSRLMLFLRLAAGAEGGLLQEPEAHGHICPNMEFSQVPLYSVELSAGPGSWVESEGIKALYAFRTEWLYRVSSSPGALKLVTVSGDSMEPKLSDGDIVLLDTARTEIKSGAVFGIREGDLVSIKRLQALPKGRIAVISDNPDYRRRETTANELAVLGRVVWSGHEW